MSELLPPNLKSILVLVYPTEEKDGCRYENVHPLKCVPELPKACGSLAALLAEGFEITAMQKHPKGHDDMYPPLLFALARR